jgi:HAD superfamily hydrolase (TIGR01509 family)
MQGVKSLVKVLNYCEFLISFSNREGNLVYADGEEITDAVRDLCFHSGLVSLILLDDSGKRHKESKYAYKLRSERVSFIGDMLTRNGSKPEILLNRDIRNSFAHIDEKLADILSYESDIGWNFNYVSTNKMNNKPEGISKIKYFNSYIISEKRIIHLDYEIDVVKLREECKTIFNMFTKTILVDAVNTFVVDGKINQELHELVETYPNKKIILTNADDEQIKEFGLENLPYELFTLKHNPDKVDPEYFTKMLEEYNLKPDEVIYFEHNRDAVKSAESVGIKTHYYDKDKKDLNILKQFLDSNL